MNESPTPPSDPNQPATDGATPTKTSLSRGWVIKSVVIIVVFLGLAAWGYLDATVIYIKRGQNHVDQARLAYLVELQQISTRRLRNAGVDDPAAELERLQRVIDEARALESNPGEEVVAKYTWLSALDKIENLEELASQNEAELERRRAGETAQDTLTLFANPREHLEQLAEERKDAKAPKPLNTWDIPLQWGFVVVGLGGGIPLLLMFLANASKSYRYDPATKTVTMPDGTDVYPDNLEAFDKRKWDKFLVFLTLKGETQERKVDLYRYTPLEDWLVEIYEASPIYEADEDAEPSDEAAAEQVQAENEDSDAGEGDAKA